MVACTDTDTDTDTDTEQMTLNRHHPHPQMTTLAHPPVLLLFDFKGWVLKVRQETMRCDKIRYRNLIPGLYS